MMIGRIVKLVREKKYGFIKDEAGTDRFFLSTHVQRTVGVQFSELNEGDTVQFEPIESERGPRAIDVARVDVLAC